MFKKTYYGRLSAIRGGKPTGHWRVFQVGLFDSPHVVIKANVEFLEGCGHENVMLEELRRV